jgi:Family of unknown function (DUF6941)
MTSPPSPLVRSLIVCEDIIADPNNRKRVSLMNVVDSIRSMKQPPYPVRQRQLCAFIQLTGCRGPGEFRVEIREADTDEVTFATKTFRGSFPNNPLAVHGLRFRLRGCKFPRPGLYWLEFFFDNQVLGQQPLTLS